MSRPSKLLKGSGSESESPAWSTSRIETNGISLNVHQQGDTSNPAIVFCHGFPSLGYSWRHQLGGLSDDFWAIAPDMRGYGDSDRPEDVEQYQVAHSVRDIVGLLDKLEIEKAIVCGHDWGSFVAYGAAVAFPDRVHGVISLSTPYSPRPPQNPIELICEKFGARNYRLDFQQPGYAESILEEDVERTFRALFRRTRRSIVDYQRDFGRLALELPIGIFVGDPYLGERVFVDAEELAVYVDTYKRTGFTGGLNWYRNIVRNWESAPEKTPQINVPAMIVRGERDIATAASPLWQYLPMLVPNLENPEIRCGHWMPEEKPKRVNRLIRNFAGKLALTNAESGT